MKIIFSAWAIALVLSAAVLATEHIVEFALPRGAGRGETVEVQLYGTYQNDPVEVVFYRPGIRCVSLDGPKSPKKKSHSPPVIKLGNM